MQPELNAIQIFFNEKVLYIEKIHQNNTTGRQPATDLAYILAEVSDPNTASCW